MTFIICSTQVSVSYSIDWIDTIKKETKGINGKDFGEVQDVSNGYFLVQRGVVNKGRFCTSIF
ncbi:hypothetical protein NARC_90097 [Candidatus Nitrosocosmicus arcticus]|uniref:Uncharacterized protein n=1 Tax=Candidatus Nitrosocosmicus arcticus TaxID=2035267 RepID=A0A557SUA8_9ARCH|nr:hypothetical protein NARC_90097 [Candidatus Nitrosocosmicus arcticus]